MVDPERIVSHPGQTIRKTIALRMRKELCSETEVDPDKPDPFLRRLLKGKTPFRSRNHASILSRRSIQHPRKVQRTAGNHGPGHIQPDPLLPLRDEKRPADSRKRNRIGSKSHRRNHPDLPMNSTESQPDRILPPQRKTGCVKTDFVNGEVPMPFHRIRLPEDHAVGEIGRIPPVSDIPRGENIDFLTGTIGEMDFHFTGFLRDGPARRVQKIKIASPGVDRKRNLTGETIAENQSGAPLILLRIQNPKGGLPEWKRFTAKLMEIVAGSLIGPSAFSIAGDRIAESHVRRLRKVHGGICDGAQRDLPLQQRRPRVRGKRTE